MIKRLLERPVLATVISILLVILGVIGLSKLPLQRFPDIAPPAVAVTAIYPGANAETILRSVAPSLEESINGVENMTYMTSTASNDGTLVITVYFKLGTNPDQAAVNVQNRVSQAQSQLPAEVIQQGITTVKQQNSLILVLSMYSDDTSKYDQTFIHNYAQINIVPELKRITGVASADIFGGNKNYSIRLWLDPVKMASYNLAPKEIIAAVQDKNLEAAPGKFGESSQESFEYVVKYKGKYNKPEDYENIVIRANANGSLLRLKDVARVEFGSYSYNSITRINGKPGINIGIMQLAGTNANDIQIQIQELVKKVSKDFPKGVEIFTLYNTKEMLDASVEQVEHTLVEAFILVFLVVFLFLQDFRSTLIPAIAVPVAIVGTFFFMQFFGFSINVLTLFALVLAIGIVVDDAIVVVEAVHAKMEHEHLAPKAATISAMNEITGAIISITLVMAAVFLPVGFMEGSTGVFYRQFALTMAISIIISAVNALTLSPVLAALFLKNTHAEKSGNASSSSAAKSLNFQQRFFTAFNTGFNSLTHRYINSVRFLLKRKWLAMGGLAILFVLTVVLVRRTPSGFIPSEDQGFLAIAVSLPPSSSLERTTEVIKQVEN
ncbi:MAG TPA: efflux RND transporter permease subunit, partial [Chitinophagales bacterium]